MRGVAIEATRVQTGLHLEERLVKVLRALAEFYDLLLGDLLQNGRPRR